MLFGRLPGVNGLFALVGQGVDHSVTTGREGIDHCDKRTTAMGWRRHAQVDPPYGCRIGDTQGVHCERSDLTAAGDRGARGTVAVVSVVLLANLGR